MFIVTATIIADTRVVAEIIETAIRSVCGMAEVTVESIEIEEVP